MKTKQIFAIIIAVIFIIAMILFHDTMSLVEIIAAFLGSSTTIGWIWQWFRAEEKETKVRSLEYENWKAHTRIENLREQNDKLFAKAYGGEKP